MSETNQDNDRFLNAFPVWLKSLDADARALVALVDDSALAANTRMTLAASLNYLLKSVDLIADGIEELGYLDDAFVLRVAARAVTTHPEAPSEHVELDRLARDAELIEEFLGEDYPRLVDYVRNLSDAPVRNRSARQIARDEGLAREFAGDLALWAQDFETPGFSRDEKNLVKLRAFLRTKLSPA